MCFSLQKDHARISQLSRRLIDGINARVSHVVRNGDPNGYPGCVNLSFAYVEGESLLMALKVCGEDRLCDNQFLLIDYTRMWLYLQGVLVLLPHSSLLTYCVRLVRIFFSWTSIVPNKIIIGAAEDMAHSSLRFGIGRFTTEAEIDYVVEKISAIVQRLRDMR